ncbi:MAG: hypothetical protein BRC22_02035 [Parcubacteria group bacterium QH_9_35_7]|nr:MAG: hypothetical protein BRC22_02035 [Parcubacteria group bacterium QH_9_35_7]
MKSDTKHKIAFWSTIIAGVLVLLAISAFFIHRWTTNINLNDVVQNKVVQKQIKKRVNPQNRFLLSLAPTFLGFDEPKTYLLLFLNNTELRPGGGFIGSYATLKVSKGKINIISQQGVEKLDSQTPKDWRPKPPDILKEELKVDRWYFRDSNWSPDFAKSSNKGLKFYKNEGGAKSEDIDFVVGITTTVLEELLKIVGPIEVESIEFSDSNVIKKLQYQVHYGFKERGQSFRNRKQIMKPFLKKLSQKVQSGLLQNYQNYLDLAREMFKEKHVVIYSPQQKTQQTIEANNLGGRVVEKPVGDYLMWVDANLAALKTDHAIERNMTYQIRKKDGDYIATAKMKYNHTGNFDWRTSRYRTFARVYTPTGTEFISAKLENKEINKEGIQMGEELNKKWFGKFTQIEPQQSKTLSFTYKLPDRIAQDIKNGSYNLVAQKQIGTLKPQLTLELYFGKNITNANPAELEKYWGDSKYNLKTNLKQDRKFKLTF